MSESTRKKFDIEEQQIRDFVSLIQTIYDVIPLIRLWGRTETKLSNFSAQVEKLENDVEVFRKTLNMISDKATKVTIESEISKRLKELEGKFHQKELLFEEAEDLEAEVISYQEYVRGMKDISEPCFYRALKFFSFRDNEEAILTIMFYIYNSGMSDKSRKFRTIQTYFDKQKDEIIFGGWNTMLAALKANEI